MDEKTKEWLKNHQQEAPNKPIHKFNGGKGATLCHNCRVIIKEKLTDDLLCDKCKKIIMAKARQWGKG